jgi:hypothetical protein
LKQNYGLNFYAGSAKNFLSAIDLELTLSAILFLSGSFKQISILKGAVLNEGITY